MSVVFRRTARSSANASFGWAAFVVAIGGLFVSLLFFADDLGFLLKAVLCGLGVGCFFWALSLVRQGRSYLRSGKDWRVEISDRYLSWQSPVEEIMASFEVRLSDIRTARHVRMKRSGRKARGYWEDYEIELMDGRVIELSEQISGIDPGKVLAALQEKGVPHVTQVLTKADEIRAWRDARRAKKKKAKNEQSGLRAATA